MEIKNSKIILYLSTELFLYRAQNTVEKSFLFFHSTIKSWLSSEFRLSLDLVIYFQKSQNPSDTSDFFNLRINPETAATSRGEI